MRNYFQFFLIILIFLIIACSSKPEDDLEFQLEKNKALVKKEFEEIWTQGKLEKLDEVFASDFTYHGLRGSSVHGREGYRPIAHNFRNAFPDMQFIISDIIAVDDKASVRWKLTGTHKAKLMGFPPTDKKVLFKGIAMYRFANGKVVELWSSWDELGMWQQLGIIPSLKKFREN